MNSGTLLPCPFCGQSGPAKVGYYASQSGLNFAVRCVCGAQTHNGEEEVCIAAWNTRTQPATDAARGISEQARELLVAAIKKHWGPFLDKPARPATANRAAEPAEPVSDEEWLQRAGNCEASLEAIESALRSPGREG